MKIENIFLGSAALMCISCASVDGYIVANTGVINQLGFQYRVCESKIRFQQLEFVVEGIKKDETKTFQVGKIGITGKQAEQINNVVLAVDSLQKQMCETTRDMALRRGDAYEKYVQGRDERFERIISVLASADAALKAGKSQETVNAQLADITKKDVTTVSK